MKKSTFGDIAIYKKGPFGSSLKKEIFVPKGKNTIKIYEQQNAIEHDHTLERYFISFDYYLKMKSFTVKAGDIIVSCAGTIGEIYTLPQNAETGVINQALMKINPNYELVNHDYFIYTFEKMINSFSNKYSNGSVIKNIPPFSDLKAYVINLPGLQEQYFIANFINKINSRINTQKKIICLLESQINQIRKTFLDKLEKENSYILLGDIIEEYNKKTTINDMYPILSSTKSGIHLQSEYFNKEAASDDTTGYKIVPKGYCTYRSMSDTGEFTFNIQNLLDVGIVSPAYPVFTTKYNNEFVIEYINNSVKLRNSILSLKEGGTRFALSLKKLMRLQIPNISIKRQKDFIDIVHKFNNKIKNEKQILLLCEKQKQYLLDKLFI